MQEQTREHRSGQTQGLSEEYDLSILADNGLRRGRTTGSCAAAAAKAALTFLITGEAKSEVKVVLPNGFQHLIIPVKKIEDLGNGRARAEVIKYAGDDPDRTDGALISATVCRNEGDEARFFAGPGVGIVTRPGIRVPVGEPAINPAPRQMIIKVIDELTEHSQARGFDITIGCEDGANIALKTFNPRLGIEGGISILGTTGIVEPMSLAAYQASIEVYVRVALAERPEQIAYLPGNIGINFAKGVLGLPSRRIVHISNFLGPALDATSDFLCELNSSLSTLWLLGHPGKLAKVLNDAWDTHSSKSTMAMSGLADLAQEFDATSAIINSMREANTVEAIISLLGDSPQSREFWNLAEGRIAAKVIQRLHAKSAEREANMIEQVKVRLFAMNGHHLGESK